MQVTPRDYRVTETPDRRHEVDHQAEQQQQPISEVLHLHTAHEHEDCHHSTREAQERRPEGKASHHRDRQQCHETQVLHPALVRSNRPIHQTEAQDCDQRTCPHRRVQTKYRNHVDPFPSRWRVIVVLTDSQRRIESLRSLSAKIPRNREL